MSLRVLFSVVSLCTSFLLASPSMDTIYRYQLDTSSGKKTFLINKLRPYVEEVAQMNNQVLELSHQIQNLSAQEDKEQILALTKQSGEKMAQIIEKMPVLNGALTIEEDFEELEAILMQKEPLSAEQEGVVERIASLCTLIDKL